MWQRKDFPLITSFRNHYQNNVTFQPLNSIVSVYRGLGSAYSPSASLRHSVVGQKKEFLPRDWEQTSIGPQKKKFILPPTQIIEFIKTIVGFRMVRWSFWKDSKLGLTLIICFTLCPSAGGVSCLCHMYLEARCHMQNFSLIY